MILRHILCLVAFSLTSNLLSSPAKAATNQSLEGQIAGLANDITEFLSGDRLLQGRKLRLDRVSSSGSIRLERL